MLQYIYLDYQRCLGGDELADVAIYLLGLSEMLGKDLEDEIKHKMEINKNREYKEINGRMVRIKD